MKAHRLAYAQFADTFTGRLNRRSFLGRAATLGMGAAIAALAQRSIRGTLAATSDTLTIAYDQSILDRQSPIQEVNNDFAADLRSNGMSLSAEGVPADQLSDASFAAAAKTHTSMWDAAIGVRPFVDMITLVETGAIEPWDHYLPTGVADDFIPSIRADGTYEEKLYIWPVLLDVIGQAWNMEQVKKAGLDPLTAPQTWDDFIANATKVKQSGAAQYGATFDIRAWRSLLPMTHSISIDVYQPDTGLFMWNSDAAVQALEIMRRVYEVANPDLIKTTGSGPDDGVAETADVGAFVSQQAAYCIKDQHASSQLINAWPDPTNLRLFPLPLAKAGVGGTAFWDTGAVLLTNGRNKQQAAEYLKALTYDQRMWEGSLVPNSATDTAGGQLPIYESTWDGLKENPPEEVEEDPWAFATRDRLDQSRSIASTKLGIRQFEIAQPYYVAYLTGDENDAKRALTRAMDAVTNAYSAL
ncbi:MAG TPA: extracellular solute-binding protein [Thermomicrobiales bacterium]|nr:extracellular solute-binding protein [Thermomicrobiales bacterium]